MVLFGIGGQALGDKQRGQNKGNKGKQRNKGDNKGDRLLYALGDRLLYCYLECLYVNPLNKPIR